MSTLSFIARTHRNSFPEQRKNQVQCCKSSEHEYGSDGHDVVIIVHLQPVLMAIESCLVSHWKVRWYCDARRHREAVAALYHC